MHTRPSLLNDLSPDEFKQQYAVDAASIETPALLWYSSIVDFNLNTMIQIAGSPERLRPHCKTHKCGEIIERELQLGIVRHKCATLAEAEMLADAGAADIMLAYCLVGPNVQRAIQFRQRFPHVSFSCTADDPQAIAHLDAAFSAAGVTIGVMLDLDVGMHRTGIAADRSAAELYRQICSSPALVPAGMHVYDGQNHQTDLAERTAAVTEAWQSASDLRDQLVSDDLPVPEIVAGGTGSFPVFAQIDDPILHLSPGTPVLYDAGYSHMFPDLPFVPAAALLTRVISRPGSDRLTLDLGYKAVASDPAVEKRAVFPELPDAKIVGQSEEHLMLQTSAADQYQIGDTLVAIPWHVCPTTSMHRIVHVVENGTVQHVWTITSRDRKLTI